MPRGDGTGPMGYGPMTGRGAGYCAGSASPGFANQMPGRGFWGRGGGRGWRHRFYATGMPGWMRGGWGQPFGFGGPPGALAARENELELLQEQAKYLNQSLEEIKKRIEDLGKEKA